MSLVCTKRGNLSVPKIHAAVRFVKFLAASQPRLDGWVIRAFKPPLSNSVVRVGAVTLAPDDVDFAVIDLEYPDISVLTLLLLFVPDLAGSHGDEVRSAALKLVEAVIGEEQFFSWSGRVVMEDRDRPAEKVAGIERRSLSQFPATSA